MQKLPDQTFRFMTLFCRLKKQAAFYCNIPVLFYVKEYEFTEVCGIIC